MAYEMKDNSGSLFRNNKREKDSHPHTTGRAMIDGKQYYISAWTKDRENGEKWQSLAFKAVEDQAKPKVKQTGGKTGFDDMDDVPW